jgi:hypothetical protein
MPGLINTIIGVVDKSKIIYENDVSELYSILPADHHGSYPSFMQWVEGSATADARSPLSTHD